MLTWVKYQRNHVGVSVRRELEMDFVRPVLSHFSGEPDALSPTVRDQLGSLAMLDELDSAPLAMDR